MSGRCITVIVTLCNLLISATTCTAFYQPSPWWSKPVTEDISTAGCLTKSQIQQAKDAGFKSLISMFSSATEEQIGDQKFPSTSEEEQFALDLGMEYKVILEPDEFDWMKLSTLSKFSAVYPSLPKPVLFHCMSAYSATFISLLYYVNTTRHQADVAVTMDVNGMLSQAAVMGFDYTIDEAPLQMLREVSGNEDMQLDVKPDLSNSYWNFGFWPLKPITKNWYFIEQLRPNQFETIKENGISTIINIRPKADSTDTIDRSVHLHVPTGSDNPEVKGSSASRPDPRRMECQEVEDATAVHDGKLEREMAAKLGLKHLTFVIEDMNVSTWQIFRSEVQDIASQSSGILLHGQPPHNAVMLALLAAGCQYGLDSAWASDVARRHGYKLQEPDSSDTAGFADEVVRIFKKVGQWSPLLAELATPVGELLGLHPIVSDIEGSAEAVQVLKAVLDNRHTMC